MKTVISVETMRASDAYTIANFTDSKALMYEAGKGIFASHPFQGKTAIVCGSGNNAGDGYVLALLLKEAGIDCRLFLLSDRFSEDGRYYYERCMEHGIPAERCTEDTVFSDYAEVVDCIYGTGFHGTVQGLAAVMIEKINGSGAFVISADMNSGLNGDTGLGELCVRSDLTVSIGYYKTGHFLNQAKDVIGSLVNCNIGIRLTGEAMYYMEAGDFGKVFGERAHFSHKGTYGYVALLGGCRSYSGAMKLANLSQSALRAGCGVAKLVVPGCIVDSVAPYLLESTLAAMPEQDGFFSYCPERLDAELKGMAAISIGMGMGQGPDNGKILAHVLEHYAVPLLIDADGLNTLARMDLELLRKTKCQVVLTPHLKEFERLSGFSREEILEAPVERAKEFAKSYGVCLLLKGTATIVTDGQTVYLTDTGSAGMATAGSGDVLSGVLTGLLGYAPCTPLTAACAAYVAGKAGEYAEQEQGAVSMLASDTAACIPKAVRECVSR